MAPPPADAAKGGGLYTAAALRAASAGGGVARAKVAVIGAGQVGATTALWIAKRRLADVTLIDIVDGLAAGKALDLMQAAPLEGFDVTVTGTTDFAALAGHQIVVVTAGLPRKPGMTREDLLTANANIVRPIAEHIKRHAPTAILIVVTNPLDIMAQLAYAVTGFPKTRVLGMAGVLDSARLRYFVAQTLHVPARDVEAMVLGGHGDQMVPLLRYTTVRGKPLAELVDHATLEQLLQRTRDGGAEIVKLLKQGSAFYAPGASVAVTVEALLNDTHATLPCAVYLDGEYGVRNLFIGVPVQLGARGVERIVELELTADERQALHRSADVVRQGIQALGF